MEFFALVFIGMVVVYWIATIFGTVDLARSKGRSTLVWGLLAFSCGIPATLLLYMLPPAKN